MGLPGMLERESPELCMKGLAREPSLCLHGAPLGSSEKVNLSSPPRGRSLDRCFCRAGAVCVGEPLGAKAEGLRGCGMPPMFPDTQALAKAGHRRHSGEELTASKMLIAARVNVDGALTVCKPPRCSITGPFQSPKPRVSLLVRDRDCQDLLPQAASFETELKQIQRAVAQVNTAVAAAESPRRRCKSTPITKRRPRGAATPAKYASSAGVQSTSAKTTSAAGPVKKRAKGTCKKLALPFVYGERDSRLAHVEAAEGRILPEYLPP